MQTTIVSGALFFVMLLLLLVVYDSNPTVRRSMARLRRTFLRHGEEAVQEGTMENEFDADAPLEPRVLVSDLEAQPSLETDLLSPKDRPKGVLNWYASYLSGVFGQKRRGGKRLFQAAPEETDKEEKPTRPRLSLPSFGRNSANAAMMETVETLANSVGKLMSRLAEAEETLGKVHQLEDGLAEANDATQFASEEMKDILGSVRSSIDGLENRLNEAVSELRDIKETQMVAGGAISEGGLDDETRTRIDQLEQLAAEMTDTIKLLPPEVRNALTSSQKAAKIAEDVGSRLEAVMENLQSTIGYNVGKTFKCDSCGSHGMVASQVVCSKCGTGTWWGWFPGEDETQADEVTDGLTTQEDDEEPTMDIEDEVNEVAEKAEMVQTMGQAFNEPLIRPPAMPAFDDELIGGSEGDGSVIGEPQSDDFPMGDSEIDDFVIGSDAPAEPPDADPVSAPQATTSADSVDDDFVIGG